MPEKAPQTASPGICFCSENNVMSSSGKAILLTAFGTVIQGAEKAYESIDRLVKKEFTGIPVYWAYTSSFIRRKLAKKGIETKSVSESLTELKKYGIKQVTVQSLHVVNGSEYEEIVEAIELFRNSFDIISLGMPLLASSSDIEEFSKALKSIIPTERTENDAIILMGHGNHQGLGDTLFKTVAVELNKNNSKIFVGTLNGRPSFEKMRKELKKSEIKRAYMIPMMVTAGKHALNDMSGADKGSWQSVLERDGIKCMPVLKGLGENDNMAAIFVDHLREAMK